MTAFATEHGEPSLQKRLIRFAIAVIGLILVIYLAQLPIRYIPAFNHYAKESDRYDIHPGALYYSDVPVRLEAEQHMRGAVKDVDDQHMLEREARANAKN